MKEQIIDEEARFKAKTFIDDAERGCIAITDDGGVIAGNKDTCIWLFTQIYEQLINKLEVPKEYLDMALKVALMDKKEVMGVSNKVEKLYQRSRGVNGKIWKQIN